MYKKIQIIIYNYINFKINYDLIFICSKMHFHQFVDYVSLQ